MSFGSINLFPYSAEGQNLQTSTACAPNTGVSKPIQSVKTSNLYPVNGERTYQDAGIAASSAAQAKQTGTKAVPEPATVVTKDSGNLWAQSFIVLFIILIVIGVFQTSLSYCL